MIANTLDLTPDPKVLVALTATPLQPIDALCELIDNAIDSFEHARRLGEAIPFPLIVVEIPGFTEVDRGRGVVRVRDNGPGLNLEMARNALKAGYSGKQRYGSLGLFGMGFNIATGKLGRRTIFTSAQANAETITVEIDLPKMIEAGTYEVPFKLGPASDDLARGTKIEIDSWWPQSSQNHGFVKKLASYPKNQIRSALGRRYASVLRDSHIRMVLNGEPCVAFEHCVWDKGRFVERRDRGQIPAQFHFDHVVHVQSRCVDCDELITSGQTACQNPSCNSQSFKTFEERVAGWLGIQRFDDQTEFGVDLIRNGRAIRVSEKAAFFEFTDEFGVNIKDYPIDSPFGRIVGEIRLNHVPVDYTKQDFERNSEEWRRALEFLRGKSSLQPTQPNADSNASPTFKLYQGYRRVRNPGTRDMYMGYFDAGKPKRISRATEHDYYQKFLERLPGYFDDQEWWKLVLQADTPPAAEVIECPNEDCRAQNVKGTDVCTVCGAVLIGKNCLDCSSLIPASALSCPECGSSQIPVIVSPWRCNICDQVNGHDAEACVQCSATRASLNSASSEFLKLNSDRDDSLSIDALSVALADGTQSPQIEVRTHVTRQHISPTWRGPRIPAVSFRGASSIDIFIDTRHRLYSALHVRPEVTVAMEAADLILQLNSRLLTTNAIEHSLSNLSSTILDQYFSLVLEDSPERVKAAARTLFDGIRFQLSKRPSEETTDLFETLTEEQAKALVSNMISQHIDLQELGTATKTSEFLRYVDNNALVEIFRRRPRLFFDGRVFLASYEGEGMPVQLLLPAQEQIKALYLNCLEDLAQYQNSPEPIAMQTLRARASLELLQSDFE